MQQFNLIAYTYKPTLVEDDLKLLTKRFLEVGTSPGVVAHYERLDGKGGFIVQTVADDPVKDYEVILQYGPWIEFEVLAVTTMEDAFPIIQRFYG